MTVAKYVESCRQFCSACLRTLPLIAIMSNIQMAPWATLPILGIPLHHYIFRYTFKMDEGVALNRVD